MPKISISGIKPQKKLFHNARVDVYPTKMKLSQIKYWPENNRTIFTFERLLAESDKKDLKSFSIEEITNYVAKQPIHQLSKLADSIEKNGVQIPLVIRDDYKLLDGNRRYFACQLLRMEYGRRKLPIPEVLNDIPVYVIQEKDLPGTLELKILAEANFIKDLKVAWPLDAQARAVDDYFKEITREKKIGREDALAEVKEVFGISRQRAIDFIEVLAFTERFVKEGGNKEDILKRKQIVEEQFVYFWEFRNKAQKGKSSVSVKEGYSEVEGFFYNQMVKGKGNPIKNVKMIEPLILARRDKDAWKLLTDSKGGKLSAVVAMIHERQEILVDEDKIVSFLSWLRNLDSVSPGVIKLLKEVVKVIKSKI